MDRSKYLHEFAIWLTAKLDELDISPAELSRLSTVKDSTISRMLAGRTRPLAETLEKIAPYIGVSVEDLLIKAGYPFTPKASTITSEERDLFADNNIRLVARALKSMPDDKRELFAKLVLSMSEETTKDAKKNGQD